MSFSLSRAMHLVVACLVIIISTGSTTTATRIGDIWGTNIHFTQESVPGEIAMLSTAFKVARMDFSWTSIESVCGIYDFSAYDSLLSAMEAVNVRSYWILDYNNPTCYPSNGKSCASSACIIGYGKLAAAAATHFQGRDIIWETVNEPNGMGMDNASDIAALAAAASAPLRAAGAMLIGPATAGIDMAYISAAFDAGLLGSVNGVSVHPYRSDAPESASDDFIALRALMTSKGAALDMPMISGEWGYTTAGLPCKYGNKRNRITAGVYVPRMWFADLLGGASIASIMYDFRDDGKNRTDCESNFGSVEVDPTGNAALPFTPKPAFLAARAAQTTLGDATAYTGSVAAVIDAAGTAAGVLQRDTFVLTFSGLRNPTSFAAYTNVSTCAIPDTTGNRTACNGASSNASELSCLTAGCCYDSTPNTTTVCYAQPAVKNICPAPGERRDCGFSGINQTTCEDTRNCCWASHWGEGPQCFFRAPVGTFNVSVSIAPPSAANECFNIVDVFGFARGTSCAVDGILTMQVSDGPAYFV
jgi:hypothetical protein